MKLSCIPTGEPGTLAKSGTNRRLKDHFFGQVESSQEAAAPTQEKAGMVSGSEVTNSGVSGFTLQEPG